MQVKLPILDPVNPSRFIGLLETYPEMIGLLETYRTSVFALAFSASIFCRTIVPRLVIDGPGTGVQPAGPNPCTARLPDGCRRR